MATKGYLLLANQIEELANGYVKIYIAGSTTLADVYDPQTGSIISNPVSIDDEGFVEAFHVSDANVYDLYFYNAVNVLKLSRESCAIVGGGGEVGPQGPQGIPGVAGPQGPQGIPGVAGLAGVNGTNGTDGSDGSDGVSLLSVAVANDAVRTVSYNLSSDPSDYKTAGQLFPDGEGRVAVAYGSNPHFFGDFIKFGEGVSGQRVGDDYFQLYNTSPDNKKTKASTFSEVEGFLNNLLVAGTGINIETTPDLNQIKIMATGEAVGGFLWKGNWNVSTAYNVNNAVWYYDPEASISRMYIATAANQGINPYDDTAGTAWSLMAIIDVVGGDQFVKIDSSDTMSGYLSNKIVAGNGITLTRQTGASGAYYNISGLQLGTSYDKAFRGDYGNTAYTHSQTTGNPHSTQIHQITGLQSQLDNRLRLTGLNELSFQEVDSSILTPRLSASGASGMDRVVVYESGSHRSVGINSKGIRSKTSDAVTQTNIEFGDDKTTTILNPKISGITGSGKLVQLNSKSVMTAASASIGSATQPMYSNAGTLTACSGTLGVSITGNSATATTATKLATTRTIALTGDVTGSGSFDGSTNLSVAVTSEHLEANTGTFTPWQTKGVRKGYTGISAPGALRVNFMSRVDANYAGLYCETDSKWMVLRHANGAMITDYTPSTTSNSTEIATTAFVNSKLSQYEFNWYNPSSTYGNWLTKVASWTPDAGTSYEISFDLDFIGSDFPWDNTAFRATIGYRDGTWSYYPTMKGQHEGYSRFYLGVNSGVCEIWLYTYGSYPRAIGRMTSQSHSFMYAPTGTWTQTIASYLTSSAWVKNVMVGSYTNKPITIQVQSLATARSDAQTIYFCT